MSLLAELKRRNVIRMAGLYLVAAWLITQVASTVLPMFGAPDWLPRTIVVLLAIGFVPTLIFSWIYELTPEGLKRDADVPPEQSIGKQTGRRIDFAIIAVLLVALAYFAVDKFVMAPLREKTGAAPIAASAGAGHRDTLVKSDSAPDSPIPDIGKDPSIAVLPLVNMSSDKEQEYFSDGISEELLNLLAKVPKLRVIARTSSFSFKGKNVPIPEIARALNVAAVLEGSVRKAGDKARITVQLIRAADSTHLWSETYDRNLDGTLAVQLDIAEHVAAALDVMLDDRQRARMQESGVKNVDAFIAFQKGRRLYEDAHQEANVDGLIATLRRAHEEFAHATGLDPGFAMAYDLGTDLYSHILLSEDATLDERAAALAAARRELDLASRSSNDPDERVLVAVDRQLLSDDWHGLAERFADATVRQGCRQTNWLRISSAYGLASARLQVARQQIACDPLYPSVYESAATTALHAGEFELALQIVADGNRKVGDTPVLAVSEISALAALGRTDAARARLSVLDASTSAGAMAQLIVAAALGESIEPLAERLRASRRHETIPEGWALVDMLADVLAGNRAAANRRAAAVDALPGGSLKLAVNASRCRCGAPFDIEATPNFRARLAESGLRWPPPQVIKAAAAQQGGRP